MGDETIYKQRTIYKGNKYLYNAYTDKLYNMSSIKSVQKYEESILLDDEVICDNCSGTDCDDLFFEILNAFTSPDISRDSLYVLYNGKLLYTVIDESTKSIPEIIKNKPWKL